MTVLSTDMDLYTVDLLRESLSTTEPLNAVEFETDSSSTVHFTLPSGWNEGLKALPGTELTSARVSVGGSEFLLTKDAALQATSLIGLTRDYVSKTPAELVEPNLNYWFKNKGLPLKALYRDNAALAFTKATVVPISNLKLLDGAVAKLSSIFGVKEEDLRVDFKGHHDLRLTQFRLILPEVARSFQTARSTVDNWSIGLEIRNSLTAESPLSLHGYLFSWVCRNGATSMHSSSGAWSRRSSPSEEDALEWAEDSVEHALSGLDHELDAVEELVKIPVVGEVNQTLRDIFDRYKVPTKPREAIMASLIDSDDLSAFGVMQAITSAANNPELSPAEVTRLLSIGGDLPLALSTRCDSCHRLQPDVAAA